MRGESIRTAALSQWRSSELVQSPFLFDLFVFSFVSFHLDGQMKGLMRSGVEMNINMYIGMVYDLPDPTNPALL